MSNREEEFKRLHVQAVSEAATSDLGTGAERSVRRSHRLVVEAHKIYKPRRIADSRLERIPKHLRSRVQRNMDTLFEGLQAAHRQHLARFYTLSGVKQDTADRLVELLLVGR